MMVDQRSWTVTLALAAAILTSGGAIHAQPASDLAPVPESPLPFDPLSHPEQQLAIDVALEDPRVQALLSESYETIGAALYTQKSWRALPEWPRMAEVWFYDHGSSLAVRAFVDLGAGDVERVESLDVQPPLIGGEVDRAGRAALADESVQQQLESMGVPAADVGWTARLWTGSGPTSCPVHRCALVGFFDGEAFVPDILVVADLTRGTVNLITPEPDTVQDGGGVP